MAYGGGCSGLPSNGAGVHGALPLRLRAAAGLLRFGARPGSPILQPGAAPLAPDLAILTVNYSKHLRLKCAETVITGDVLSSDRVVCNFKKT